MRFLKVCGVLAAVGASGAALHGTAVAQESDLRLAVDLSERKLTVHRGGEVTQSFEVAIGTSEHPTPRGDFTISRIIWNPSWVPPNEEWAEDEERQGPGDPDNPMKTAKIFFQEPDYYIHGTGETETLGTAASHGCIRMRPWEVAELAKLVMESRGEGRSQEWYDRVIEDDLNREITLDEPVPMTVSG